MHPKQAITGLRLTRCQVNLKLRENKDFCVIVRIKENPYIYTTVHAVTIFNRNVRVQKHRLIGAKFEVPLSKYILPPNTVVCRTSPSVLCCR